MDRPIVHAEVDEYLARVAPPRDAVLAMMEALAVERDFPIVGPLVGRALHTLALAGGARRVFEMGSGYGYSAVWLARAVGPEGHVQCTDGLTRHAEMAHAFLREAGVESRVTFTVGDAREELAKHDGPFDMIFCDIDKEHYPEVPDLALPRLRVGGLLVIDNMLWYGRVVDPRTLDAETRGVQELTRRLYARDDVSTTILPLRDGLSVSVKLR